MCRRVQTELAVFNDDKLPVDLSLNWQDERVNGNFGLPLFVSCLSRPCERAMTSPCWGGPWIWATGRRAWGCGIGVGSVACWVLLGVRPRARGHLLTRLLLL
jgi:hypothetical protein